VGLAQFWQLADRPQKFVQDSPGGLLLTLKPLQLHVRRLPGNVNPVEGLLDELTAIQIAVCEELCACSSTKLFLSPALKFPKQLKYQGGREVSALHLSQALEIVMGMSLFEGYTLCASGFGMKGEVTDCGFYDRLRAAMTGAHPDSYIDLAVELGKNESQSPWVCRATDNFMDGARHKDYDFYPMFPGVAGNIAVGGFTFKETSPQPTGLLKQPSGRNAAPHIGKTIPKIKVYSVWAHNLMDLNQSCRVPVIVPTEDGKSMVRKNWFFNHEKGVTSFFRAAKQPRMASGLRFEFRICLRDLEITWAAQLPLMLQYLAAAVQTVEVMKVRHSTVLYLLWHTLQAAVASGLFDTSQDEDGYAPTWKVDAFHRVLCSFGWTCKYWSIWVFKLYVRGASWGPAAAAAAAAPALEDMEHARTLEDFVCVRSRLFAHMWLCVL
jgi:hypothetical protein